MLITPEICENFVQEFTEDFINMTYMTTFSKKELMSELEVRNKMLRSGAVGVLLNIVRTFMTFTHQLDINLDLRRKSIIIKSPLRASELGTMYDVGLGLMLS